jgi:hypothetical protein
MAGAALGRTADYMRPLPYEIFPQGTKFYFLEDIQYESDCRIL